MDVADRVVLITGASSGVGAALAIKLAEMGARVVVNYSRSAEAAEAVVTEITAAGGQALAVQADVSEEADCKRLVATTVEHFGQLDVLVNNAGTTTFVPHDELDALTEDIWLRTLRVNLVGAFMMSREVAPHIEAAGGGEIVMTSSIASTTANGSSIAYCASKAGMNSLTRTLAKTLGKKKIRVNAVLPGLIDGDWAFNTWGGGDAEQYEAGRTAIERCIKLIENSGDIGPYLQASLVWMVAGEIYGHLSDRDAERLAYESALESDPGSFQAMNNLGTAYLRAERLDDALDMYTRANAIAPNIPTIQENIRRVNQRMAKESTSNGGRLTLCMIAGNEEERLGKCLESVQGLVDEIVVVDTGSTDRTVEIAESFGAKLGSFPWNDNFSDARNESLKLATGDWIMWLDPDDLLPQDMHGKIREAMRAGLGKKKAYFWILDDQGYEPVTCLQLRLFPNLPGVEFRQPIHEQLAPSLIELGVSCEPTEIRVVHTGYTTPEVVREKQERYLGIMESWLADHPDDYIVRSHAAQTQYIHGRLDEAIANYHQIIEDSACHSDHNLIIETTARLFLGRCYIRTEQYEDALENLQRAYELDDQYALTLLTLGECYTRMGRHDEALEVLERAKQFEGKVSFTATDPRATRYSIRFAIGENLESKGVLDDALVAYREASEADPRKSSVLGAMSTVYRKLGQRDLAIETLERARELDPDNLQHAFNRGTFYLEEGADEEARALFEQVVVDEIDLYAPYLNLGYLARRRGDVADAETYYRKAATFEEGVFDANCNLGHLLIGEGRYQDAYAAFSGARSAKDSILDVNLGQCVAACGVGKHIEAVDPLKAVLSAVYEQELGANLPAQLSVQAMGQLLSESGRMLIEKNLIACTQLAFLGAYLLEPENLQYGLQLAEVYRAMNDPWKAVKVYEEQIKAYPTEPELFKKLREVYTDLGAHDAVRLCDEHLAQLSGGSGPSAQQAC